MAESLNGFVDRITYHNEENGYTIAQLKVLGKRARITLAGAILGVKEGENIEVQGEWVQHPQYGRQLQVETFKAVPPSTQEGIRRYLGSGLIKGVGPVMAKRIVERFGKETLEIIDTNPFRLLEIPKLGRKKIELIARTWAEQREIKDVMIFLQSHGVSTGYAVKIFKHYGQEVIKNVQENPYRLEREIDGIGFRIADQIAQRLGFAEDSQERVQAGIRYLLNRAADDGHVYLPLVDLMERGKELLQVSAELFPPALDELRQDDGIVTEETRYYLPPLYHSEVGIASALQRLQRSAGVQLEPLAEIPDGLVLAVGQQRAVKWAASEKVLVLTGGPGTGKTTVTRAILELYTRNKLKVMLCSPTGRAAKRLSEATGREAKTIHRLLEFVPAERRFKKDYDDKLELDALIVDEASMVDVVLMNALLRALPSHTHLVVVGDVDQLPSVGPGNVLRDIIDSGQVPVVRLDEIFRQGRESQIILNAHRINNGEMPSYNNTRGTDFFFLEEDDAGRMVELIEDLVARRLPAHGAYDPLRDIQVLTPMYRGDVGAQNLNECLQQKLNSQGQGHKQGGMELRVGDKVMQVRNNYDKGVFNGDMGIVTSIDSDNQVLRVLFDAGVDYDFAHLDELVLAYAISIHRSQGSEFPVVVLPLSTQHYIMLQRNLLYTAVTRAKKMLVIVGTRAALERAVENNEVAARFATLKVRILGQAGERL
jgi:exodeoxyribonuclease V alpha subunit